MTNHFQGLRGITVFIGDEFTSAFGFSHFGRIIARKKGSFEKLDSNNGEHELKIEQLK
jgi:hypothetical protein